MTSNFDNVDGEHQRSCCTTFWSPLTPQFGDYVMHNAGGSFWAPTWLLFSYRLAVGLSLVAILIWASIFGQIPLIIACCMWLPEVVLLATSSYLLANDRKEPTLLSNICIPMYQSMLSLSVFCFPMFILLASRSLSFLPQVIFNAAAIALALFDILALGARVRFKIVIIWLPIVIDLLVFGISVAILTAFATSAGLSAVLGTSNVAGAIALCAIYALVWPVASSVIAVIVTRSTDCCYPFRSMEEESTTAGCWHCGQGTTLDV